MELLLQLTCILYINQNLGITLNIPGSPPTPTPFDITPNNPATPVAIAEPIMANIIGNLYFKYES